MYVPLPTAMGPTQFWPEDSMLQVRMDDIPSLLTEYKQLLHLHASLEETI
jgi:hypothetical protein